MQQRMQQSAIGYRVFHLQVTSLHLAPRLLTESNYNMTVRYRPMVIFSPSMLQKNTTPTASLCAQKMYLILRQRRMKTLVCMFL